MHKLLLLLSLFIFLNGCAQQNKDLLPQTQSLSPAAPYSLEYLDALYRQTQKGN